MRRCLVGIAITGLVGATLAVAGPARAAGLGVSVGSDGARASASVGGAGADVSVGGSRGGVSAGGGVDAGGTSAQGGGSVGGGGASAGAAASGGGGGASGGASADTSGGASVSAGSGSASDAGSRGGNAAATTQHAPDVLVRKEGQTRGRGDSRLPKALRPRDNCVGKQGAGCGAARPNDQSINRQTPQFRNAVAALASFDSAPLATVTACRNGIIQGATPYNPVQVDAVSAGEVVEIDGGGQMAPLVVRIVYSREGGYETREAEVQCQLDQSGTVVALI